jgi:phosphoketolase
MNLVNAVGGKVAERNVAVDVVNFCIKKMMPRMRTLDITVEFAKNLDAYGYCEVGDTNREFTVTIKKGLSIWDLITTLCHEMVHVKQYARNELRYVNGDTMWKKKAYNNVDYADAPWEKEAYRLEDKLGVECIKEINTTL